MRGLAAGRQRYSPAHPCFELIAGLRNSQTLTFPGESGSE